MAPGIPLDQQEIASTLTKGELSPFPDIRTERTEKNHFEIKTGLFKGYTTGAPITIEVKNQDVISKEYMERRNTPRPGHADLTSYMKYGGFNDYRGGGRSSGRVMVAVLAAGCIAKKILKQFADIRIYSFTSQIGSISYKMDNFDKELLQRNPYDYPSRCPDRDTDNLMIEEIIHIKEEGDSVGGIISCYIFGIPIGIGEPLFNNIESSLASALFAIPGVKGIEFGTGFHLEKKKFQTRTNHAGGILGGVSTGMPITFRVAFKPTPSIAKPQVTVNVKTLESTTLKIKGRFDPCIVPRAVIIVEQITAITLVDLFLSAKLSNLAPKIKKI
jgi:chorismate synthase